MPRFLILHIAVIFAFLSFGEAGESGFILNGKITTVFRDGIRVSDFPTRPGTPTSATTTAPNTAPVVTPPATTTTTGTHGTGSRRPASTPPLTAPTTTASAASGAPDAFLYFEDDGISRCYSWAQPSENYDKAKLQAGAAVNCVKK